MTDLEAHYDAVRKHTGEGSGENLPGQFGTPSLRRRFVAVDGRRVLETATDRPTIVCTGVGMTGPPHLGTLGQLLTAIELQAAGLEVQFVLADLEPYHHGAAAEPLDRLAERYRAFALELGFDPDCGTLRTQSEALAVMGTAQRLSRYYDPAAWPDGAERGPTDWEQSVEALYEEAETEAEASDAAVAVALDGRPSRAAALHSDVLHAADFLHPLRTGNVEQIVLCFGADEYDLLPWIRHVRDASPVAGPIAGCFTRLVPGFGNVPKQSKSIGAGCSLAADPAALRRTIASAPDPAEPERSTVFQAMCLAGRFDAERLADLERACEDGGERWAAVRERYAEQVAEYARTWQATGS